MNSIIWPTMAEVGLISYRSMRGIHFVPTFTQIPQSTASTPVSKEVNDGVNRPPLPSELLALMLVFGIFGAIAETDARIGGLLGWGVVIATGIVMFGSSK